MLSVLIPIYNVECTELVAEISAQCNALNLQFEIICIDDKSEMKYKEKNKCIKNILGVIYKELNDNIGRSKIRNLLAKQASYDRLLFIDSDSVIVRSDFIAKYLKAVNNHKVIYGGRNYPNLDNLEKEFVLHYRYAKKYEALDENHRQVSPYLSFMSNNFLILKDIFNSIKFDENISGYGYEDTLLALTLRNDGIEIFHIDNPVMHNDLKSTDKFLSETEKAIQNLVELKIKSPYFDTHLTKFYNKLRSVKLNNKFYYIFDKFKQKVLNNLKSSNPNLYFFQFYKLYLYIHYSNSANKRIM